MVISSINASLLYLFDAQQFKIMAPSHDEITTHTYYTFNIIFINESQLKQGIYSTHTMLRGIIYSVLEPIIEVGVAVLESSQYMFKACQDNF